MSGETTKRYSIAELRALREREGSRTDWARVDAQSEAELEAAIAADPDSEGAPGGLEDAVLVTPERKVAISIRLDRDVLDWYRASGPGYQTRMSEALRQVMEGERSGG